MTQVRRETGNSAGAAEADAAKTISRIFIMLYLQFAFYWGTIAAGMYANYYYAVPDSVGAGAVSIFTEIFSDPDLIAHVVFAVLSTGMSVPIIFYLRRVGMKRTSYLHMGAITSRMFGFVAGPLFIFYSTASMANGFSANLTTFIMACAFIVAVILSFMSRIFIVREDVRVKYGSRPQALPPRETIAAH